MFSRFWIENVPAITESPSKCPVREVSHGDIFRIDVLNLHHHWLPKCIAAILLGHFGSLIFFPQCNGIQDTLELWISHLRLHYTDSRYWIPAFVSGSLILNPIVIGILDSLGCIPDSKARIPEFASKNFPDSEIQIPSSHGAIFWEVSHTVESTMCPIS